MKAKLLKKIRKYAQIKIVEKDEVREKWVYTYAYLIEDSYYYDTTSSFSNLIFKTSQSIGLNIDTDELARLNWLKRNTRSRKREKQQKLNEFKQKYFNG